jgi:hypothetical protein
VRCPYCRGQMSSGRVRIGQTTLGAITDFVTSFGSMPHYVYFSPRAAMILFASICMRPGRHSTAVAARPSSSLAPNHSRWGRRPPVNNRDLHGTGTLLCPSYIPGAAVLSVGTKCTFARVRSPYRSQNPVAWLLLAV